MSWLFNLLAPVVFERESTDMLDPPCNCRTWVVCAAIMSDSGLHCPSSMFSSTLGCCMLLHLWRCLDLLWGEVAGVYVLLPTGQTFIIS